MSWYVDKNDYNKKKKSSKNSLKGMNILSGIEYRKALYKTQAAQGDGYKMIIPTIDGKMLVRYSGTFSIFDNKQLAIYTSTPNNLFTIPPSIFSNNPQLCG